MKAPIYAYVVGEDNNFYKMCLRKGGTGSGGITPVDPDGPIQVQP